MIWTDCFVLNTCLCPFSVFAECNGNARPCLCQVMCTTLCSIECATIILDLLFESYLYCSSNTILSRWTYDAGLVSQLGYRWERMIMRRHCPTRCCALADSCSHTYGWCSQLLTNGAMVCNLSNVCFCSNNKLLLHAMYMRITYYMRHLFENIQAVKCFVLEIMGLHRQNSRFHFIVLSDNWSVDLKHVEECGQ